ncbi:MAG: hypothetical protein KA778_01815 [Burkholderiaceae bacterium]|nr:hypothetical protein [Burkholderiaceae bacterium]MBP7658713.1 hypothetical protein [Burkholderiaceae bacterium]
MAEIKNYTLNFSSGRQAVPALTRAARASAFTEVQCDPLTSAGAAHG